MKLELEEGATDQEIAQNFCDNYFIVDIAKTYDKLNDRGKHPTSRYFAKKCQYISKDIG